MFIKKIHKKAVYSYLLMSLFFVTGCFFSCSRTDYTVVLSQRLINTFSLDPEEHSQLTLPIDGWIDSSRINIYMPYGTVFPLDMTPSFSLEGFAFYVDGMRQTSRSDTHSVEKDQSLNYRLYSYDGRYTDYTVTLGETEAYFEEFYFDRTENSSLSENITPVISGDTLWVYLPRGTDPGSLIPRFKANTLAGSENSVTIESIAQTSGVDAIDLSNPVIYTVHANGKEYYSCYRLSSYGLISFSFSPDYNSFTGTYPVIISDTDIFAPLPQEADLSALTPSFSYSGSGVTINGEDALSEEGIYNFQGEPVLSVYTDKGNSHAYRLRISNNGLVCSAGNDSTVGTGISCLQGSAYSIIANDTLSYEWVELSGPESLTLNSPSTLTPSFAVTPDTAEGLYQFRLTVTNSVGDSASDTVTVAVNYGPQIGIKNLDAETGGSISFEWYNLGTSSDFGSLNIECREGVALVDSQNKFSESGSYSVSGLSDGVEYTFTLVALDSEGNSTTQTFCVKNGESYHLLYTPFDLAGVGSDTGEYTNWLMDHNYILMRDIDLKDYKSGEGWVPIGASGDPFSGTFDGSGKTVANLYINRSQDNQGLFGYIIPGGDNRFIKNVSVICADEGVILASNAAILCGFVDANSFAFTLSNCSVTGVLTCSSSCGGIAGFMNNINGGTLTIEKCRATVTITGTNSLGGLIGNVQNTTASDTHISDSSAYMNITATAGYSGGGLVGRATVGLSTDSSTMTIERCFTRGTFEGQHMVGGIVGCKYGSTDLLICDSYSRCSLKASSQLMSHARVGGLAAYLSGSGDIGVYRSYSTGYLSYSYDRIGGIHAETFATATASACYYDRQSSGYDEKNGNPTFWTSQGTPKSTGEMKTEETFAGWDFNTVWSIDSSGRINDGYPYLRGLTGQE